MKEINLKHSQELMDNKIRVNETKSLKLYQDKFILIIGTVFAVYIGAILMAINFYQFDKKKFAWIIVPIAIIYASLKQVALNYGIITFPMTFPVNFLGIFLLKILFWDNLVPKKIEYKKRSIWIPLIISIVMWAPTFYYMFIRYFN